jgi:PAS domain-containing protein
VATPTLTSQNLPELGRLLKERRRSLDMTFKDVRQAIGCWIYSERTLRRIESGEFVPARSKLLLLAIEALKIDRVGVVAHLCGLAGYEAMLTKDEIGQYNLETVDDRTARVLDTQQALNSANLDLIKRSPIAVFATDFWSKVLIWNPAAEDVFGWLKSEVINQPLPCLPGEEGLEFDRRGFEFSQRQRNGSHTRRKVFTLDLVTFDGERAGMFFAVMPRKLLMGRVAEIQTLLNSFAGYRELSSEQLEIVQRYRSEPMI